MQTYIGSRATIKVFENNDTDYLTEFNDNTLKVLADLSFVDAPIDGSTEILDESITGDKIVDGTITSDKLAAALSVGVLANDIYLKGRNQADNADLNMIKVNTSNLLEAGIYWNELRLANNKKSGARTVGGADADWMKENTSDQWEWLSTAYSQNIFAKTTNTYDLGGTSNVYNKAYIKNLRVSDASTSVDFYAQGTWSPTIIGTTTAGTASYATQNGYYIKLGNIVILSLTVSWSAGTGTGNLQVSNFPYTNVNGQGYTILQWRPSATGSSLTSTGVRPYALMDITGLVYCGQPANATDPANQAYAAQGAFSVNNLVIIL